MYEHDVRFANGFVEKSQKVKMSRDAKKIQTNMKKMAPVFGVFSIFIMPFLCLLRGRRHLVLFSFRNQASKAGCVEGPLFSYHPKQGFFLFSPSGGVRRGWVHWTSSPPQGDTPKDFVGPPRSREASFWPFLAFSSAKFFFTPKSTPKSGSHGPPPPSSRS